MAAGAIEGFDVLAAAWEQGAPLTWDLSDPEPVADAVLFLLSRLSRAITGEILHVDGGFHALGAHGVAVAAAAES
jgi:enoyl-[acyl-carrier protein] reductase I